MEHAGRQLQALVELNPPLADRETEQKKSLDLSVIGDPFRGGE